MPWLFANARYLLILHTFLAVAATGAATHLVVAWVRYRRRGKGARLVRRFTLLCLGLYAPAFLLGNAIYPVYKLKVRAEWLEHPRALVDDKTTEVARAVRTAEETQTASRLDPAQLDVYLDQQADSAFAIVQWFDIKEHLLALGLFALLALAFVVWPWQAQRAPTPTDWFVASLIGFVVGVLWLACVVGLLVAAWRAV